MRRARGCCCCANALCLLANLVGSVTDCFALTVRHVMQRMHPYHIHEGLAGTSELASWLQQPQWLPTTGFHASSIYAHVFMLQAVFTAQDSLIVGSLWFI